MTQSALGRIVVQDANAPLYLITFEGEPSEAEFDAYLERLTAIMQRPDMRAMVYDASRATLVPASQRKKQAQWMQRFEAETRRSTAGIAFVIPSTVIRGMFTAILWLQPLACPHTVVATLGEGVAWARERLAAGPGSLPAPNVR